MLKKNVTEIKNVVGKILEGLKKTLTDFFTGFMENYEYL